MSVTVKSTRAVGTRKGFGGSGPSGPNGNGSGNGWRPKKGGDGRRRFSPAMYRLAMWIGLGAIVMMFFALSSTYLLLPTEGWRPIKVPRLFFLSTGVICASSYTAEKARRSLKQGKSSEQTQYLFATLLFGLTFLTLQLLAWKSLIAQKVFLAGQPHSSFFYLFTGLHGVHLLGGMIGLLLLIRRSRRITTETDVDLAVSDAVSLYWHFMGAIWLWLFILLSLWK